MDADGASIVIPTLNGGEVFVRCLEAIRNQDFDGKIELVVIDSGSTDGTVTQAEAAGARVIRIRPSEFHHAGTRNLALGYTECDYVVYTVQDAIPATRTWLRDLCRALSGPRVVAAYGRPIAHNGAGVYARFEADGISRYLGDDPYLQELSGPEAYAAMSFDEAYRVTRLDNVCAIYRREALRDCPFPRVPYAEDMAWALEMLRSGARILYEPAVVVKHSHERPAAYVFRRHVVDAVYCARILGKLRRDLSAAGAQDLLRLTSWFADRTRRLSRVCEGGNRNAEIEDALLPLASCLGNEIDYLWDVINSGYTFSSRREAQETLEKAAASVLGKCYGDVFAARSITGTIDCALSEIVEPYLMGI